MLFAPIIIPAAARRKKSATPAVIKIRSAMWTAICVFRPAFASAIKYAVAELTTVRLAQATPLARAAAAEALLAVAERATASFVLSTTTVVNAINAGPVFATTVRQPALTMRLVPVLAPPPATLAPASRSGGRRALIVNQDRFMAFAR